jgi:hypothetical protein
MLRFSTLRFSLTLLIFSLLLGCSNGRKGDNAIVLGSVTLDGTAVADAQVRFLSKDNKPELGTAQAKTNAKGEFIIKPDDKDNNWLMPGKFMVLISKIPPIQANAMGAPEVNLLPPQYSLQAKTPLVAELKNGENKLPPFELVDKKK